MEKVLQKLPKLSNAAGTKDTDLIFLRGLMESPIIQSLPKAQARLEEPKLEAVRERNVELVHEIVEDFAAISQQDGRAAELLNILQEPHFQSLLEVHDSVASRSYEQLPCGSEGFGPPGSGGTQDIMLGEAVRVVGIRKMDGEPLGVTFRVDGGELVIARILRGGAIDRQGLLHVGDVIREVNGHEVAGDPSGLQSSLRDASGSVVLKVLPSYTKPPFSSQIFVKCHFNYDPTTDHLIPCREAGLAFSQGEVLQVVSLDDPSWWQACKMQGGGRVGLVPSQTLEEKRKAYVRSDFDCTSKGNLCGVRGKKKKRMMYVSTKNAEFDQHEILLYEEVANMPPFQRKTLVLIGAQGVGRRSLKNRLIMADPTRYGSTIPCTSRQPRDDEHDRQSYRFVHRSDMEADIKMGAYLESGEYDGNLYGTRIDSIHNVISSGRTCVLDTNTQALKLLRTAEYMPYVVFIAAPPLAVLQAMHRMGLDAGTTSKPLTDNDLKKTSEESNRIQQSHGQYFDVTILNESLDETYKKLLQVLNQLTVDYQWVPVSWVY